MFNILVNASNNLSEKKLHSTLDSILKIYTGNFFFICVFFNDQEYLYDSIENKNYNRIRFCVLDKDHYPKLKTSNNQINSKFDKYNRNILAINAGLAASPLIKTFIFNDDYIALDKLNLPNYYNLDKSIVFLKREQYISISKNITLRKLWDVPFIGEYEINNIFNYGNDNFFSNLNKHISEDFGLIDYLNFSFYKKNLMVENVFNANKKEIRKYKARTNDGTNSLLISKYYLSKSKLKIEINSSK